MNNFLRSIRINRLLDFLSYGMVFIGGLYPPLDADLGWHLKYGEYFFQHHTIVRENIFSTMMPLYHWVNSSWGTDIITYSAFHNFGFFGITILGAIVITLTFFFLAKAARMSFWDKAVLFPILYYLQKPINGVSFRGQLLSLLLLGVLFFVLRLYTDGKKKALWFLPLLFMLWSNLHGQFIVGLGLFFGWIGLRFIISQFGSDRLGLQEAIRRALKELAVFVVCALAVMVNPFTYGVYEETIRHLGNPWQKYIVEWLPFEKFSVPWFSHIFMGFFLVFVTIFLLFDKKLKKHVPVLGLAFLLFVFSLWMRRYTWPMYCLAFVMMQPIASYFKPKSTRFAMLVSVVILTFVTGIIVRSKVPFQQFTNMNWQNYCATWQCSDQAAQFIITNNLNNDTLMTLYHWGGWLIYNYPQIKPSIDGRMHLWRDENGYSAFAEYYPYEQNWRNIDESRFDAVFMSLDKPVYQALLRLADEGKWNLVYEDDLGGIFVRNKNYQRRVIYFQ